MSCCLQWQVTQWLPCLVALHCCWQVSQSLECYVVSSKNVFNINSKFLNFRYDFEISLNAESNHWFGGAPSITLLVDDSLRNLTLELRPKDRIWFSGVLSRSSSLGPDVRVTADEIGCVSCLNKELTSAKVEDKSIITLERLKLAFNRILNFVLNPVIIFRWG